MSVLIPADTDRATLKKKWPLVFGALLFVGLTGTQCATDDNASGNVTSETAVEEVVETTAAKTPSAETGSSATAGAAAWAEREQDESCGPEGTLEGDDNPFCEDANVSISEDGSTLEIAYVDSPRASEAFGSDELTPGSTMLGWETRASLSKWMGNEALQEITKLRVSGPGGSAGTWDETLEVE